MKTHYDVLGVTPASDREAVRRAYVELARRHHPDAGGDPSAMRAVNDAWEVLADPSRRARYDASIGIAPATRAVDPDPEVVDDPAWRDAAFDADGLEDAIAAPSGSRRRSLVETASLLAVLALAALTALTLLFGMMLTISELLGLGIFLGFLTGIAILARMLLAMRTSTR